MTELVNLIREKLAINLEAAGLEVPEQFRISTVVWFDGLPEQSIVAPIFQASKLKLRRFIRTFESFSDPDECNQYITALPLTENVLVIVTPPVNVGLLSRLNRLLQVNIIDIFLTPTDDTDYSSVINDHNIKAIVCDIAPIVNQLKERKYIPCANDLLRFNFLSNSVTSSNNFNKQDASFIYVQLFTKILSRMDFTSDDMRDMIQFFREKFGGNRHNLAFVDIIEREYYSHSPIWFYTQPKFLYGILNKALYDYDIETMFAMRIFIRDLHNQIDKMFKLQQEVVTFTVGHDRYQMAGNILETTTILYRGQRMLKDELEKLKLNEDGLLSINNFLSTSTDENIARMFSGEPPLRDLEECAVVFKIYARAEFGFWNAPFVNITSASSLGSDEQEYLFTTGSIFRIGHTQRNADGYWYVNLKLTDEHDPKLLEAVGPLLQTVNSEAHNFISMGTILLIMGGYELAEGVLRKGLVNEKNPIDLCYGHMYLGKVYGQIGNVDAVRYHHEMALRVYKERKPIDPEYTHLAAILVNLGRMYEVLDELRLAQYYIEKSIELETARKCVDFKRILMAHFTISHILKKQGKLDEALVQGQVTLDIAHEILSPNSDQIVDMNCSLIASCFR